MIRTCSPATQPSETSRANSRRGASLLLAVVLCVLATALTASLIRTLALTSLRVDSELDRNQTEFLLDAGEQLAMARLANDPDYREDTWEPNLPGDRTATVQIKLAGDDSEPGSRSLQIHVTLQGARQSFSRSRTVSLEQLPASIEGPTR